MGLSIFFSLILSLMLAALLAAFFDLSLIDMPMTESATSTLALRPLAAQTLAP